MMTMVADIGIAPLMLVASHAHGKLVAVQRQLTPIYSHSILAMSVVRRVLLSWWKTRFDEPRFALMRM